MKREHIGEPEMDESKGTILIVDDDESLRSDISRDLEAKGYSCVGVADTREAVETASTCDFDLVVMDMRPPGASRIRRALRKDTDDSDTGLVSRDAIGRKRTAGKSATGPRHDDSTGSPDEDTLPAAIERVLKHKKSVSKTGNGRLRQIEEERQKHAHDLGERVKELSCLYGISNIASRQDASLDDMLRGIVSLIPPSWQYPEITCARIVCENQEFHSDNFVESQWKLSREIIVHGELAGAVEVCYLEEKPGLDEGPFLKEERKLIDAIAERLGRIIERRKAEEELAQNRDQLEKLVEERTEELLIANEQLRGTTDELQNANKQLQSTTDELQTANEQLLSEIVERQQADQRLRELYEQEKELRQRIEDDMSRRVEFTRAIAHELKSPLTSIISASESLTTAGQDEMTQRLTGIINRSACNLDASVEELLDLARGELGRLEVRVEPLDLLRLLRDSADAITPVASKLEQQLVLDLPRSLPSVMGDETRLRQVLSNLLDNAMKFSPRGESITLHARHADSAVVIEVRDAGRGISENELKRVFDPYYTRAEKGKRSGGLGLGLALCKMLIELQGGEIWATSDAGKGSVFSFSLPLEVGAPSRTVDEGKNSMWTVLIIEDDLEIVESLKAAFQLRWPEVRVVSTRLGEEGIDLVETEAPDVVVLDLGLPEMDGLDVLRGIRFFSSVPVIILTVRSEDADIVGGLDAGADDYMTKPYSQAELMARLKLQLHKRGPPDEEAPVISGSLRYDPATLRVTRAGTQIDLTAVEGHILHCLMRSPGSVVTYSRLIEFVWGEDYPELIDSLRVHVRRIREKLEADPSRPTLICTKSSVGYSLTSSA